MESANNISFYKPFIKENTNSNIQEVLNFDDTSSKTEELERVFAQTFETGYALATMSGTAALHLAMCALDLKRGDKVLCSINAFVDVPEVIRHFDAEPIFVDCDSNNYMIDLDKLEIALRKNENKKLRAVLVNHMGGAAPDLDRLYKMAKEYDVKVIEDATDAMGTKYNGKYLGSTGADITVFSFAPHMYKDIISGGIFTTKDDELYERAKLLRTHGMTHQSGEHASEVNYLYDVIDIGWRYAMNEIVSVICLDRFTSLQEQIERRKQIAQMYVSRLENTKHITIKTDISQENILHFFIEIDKNRDHFARELKLEGIDVGLHYMPLHLTEYYRKKYSLRVFDFPVALGVYQRTLSLPLYAGMSDNEVQIVIEAVEKIANSYM
ncbi:MAG: DegT/DnrJ/EryC1/StrS aminotransferase family protein [Sulfurovaceae bacterium]|nr:DegT/DnrJ/EryC1/StrS aminotransferase family protein [Sulfurovaceae bacterium]